MPEVRPSHVRRPRSAALIAALALAFTVLAPGAAQAAPAKALDCPTPSWGKMAQMFLGNVIHTNAVNSQAPGGTLYLNSANGYTMKLTHTGDVRPRTRAVFDYIDPATGNLVDRHITNPSRSNGVIHHEPEEVQLFFPAGTVLDLYGSFEDECGAGYQRILLGQLQVN
ncbi:hypothetical protein [Rhizohabitans arisaemae]|uniref:hypothetical protein n=1 Tax=Rhizohabitans arisaemae TaxID=2720610 RepID=UPI0024B1E144|nr:hypothetical protein [Rhizohabitans arisaemae]